MAHQKRQTITKKIPIPRKGTTFVARANANTKNSIPVVVAIRDILKLARTAREVQLLINNKKLKINNRVVKNLNDSIQPLNILYADKPYILTFTPNGRFIFNETKLSERPCKVINKTAQKANKIQLNLHDGTNILTTDKKIQTNDTIYLNLENKITKHTPLDKAKQALVISGRHTGDQGKITKLEEKKLTIDFTNKEGSAEIEIRRVLAE